MLAPEVVDMVDALSRLFAARHPSLDRHDLAQEAYLAILPKLAEWDSSRGVPPAAYLRRRARGAMQDAIRASMAQCGISRVRAREKGTGSRHVSLDEARDMPTVWEPPDDDAVPHLLARHLSFRARRVVELRAVEGMSFKDIARVLHMSVKGANRVYHDSITILRHRLLCSLPNTRDSCAV